MSRGMEDLYMIFISNVVKDLFLNLVFSLLRIRVDIGQEFECNRVTEVDMLSDFAFIELVCEQRGI